MADMETGIAEPVIERGVALRAPDVPVTLEELSAHREQAIEIVRARADILETLTLAAIRRTDPEDWLLFRTKDGAELGYLQDCGADRVADLWGISVYDVKSPERTALDGGAYLYSVRGSGRCGVTGKTVMDVEGCRTSDEDFCSRDDVKPGMKEVLVRKAARANLDGSIVRELSGMKSVPLARLTEAWKGTAKNPAKCHRGRGYGSGKDREAGKVAENGVSDEAVKLGDEIMKRTNGDKEAARALLLEITKADRPDKGGKLFPGFDSCARFTMGWQVENAWKKLLAHPTFGDEMKAEEASTAAEKAKATETPTTNGGPF